MATLTLALSGSVSAKALLLTTSLTNHPIREREVKLLEEGLQASMTLRCLACTGSG